MESISQPLSNAQVELLKLFSTKLSENELKELKELLANFCAQKSIQSADKVWEEKKLTQNNMIQPASIKEFMDFIAKKYQELPDGKEKTELWEEIVNIANRYDPNIEIEEINTDE